MKNSNIFSFLISCLLIYLLIRWFLLLYFNIFSDDNSANINTPISNNKTISNEINNNKCLFNWTEIEKPLHSSCTKNDENIAWKCDSWYYEKDNYCWCSSSEFNCLDIDVSEDIILKMEKLKIKIDNTKIDEYNQTSMDYYNSLITEYNDLVKIKNKFLNENCNCEF